MPSELQFKINDLLSLRLEDDHTYIYVKDTRFIQCIRLILDLEKEKISDYDEIDSIDEAVDVYKQSLWRNKIVEGPMARPSRFRNESISPEEEFWGHCSNVQMWVESNYDTRLLHRNISFGLLKKLTDAGDGLARRAFKEEVAIRYLSGFTPVKLYLIDNNYLYYLTREELQSIIDIDDLENLRKEYIDNLHIQVNITSIYVQIGRIQKALEVIEFVKAQNSNIRRIWHNSANVYIYIFYLEKQKPTAKKYLDLAINCMIRALKITPTSYYSLTRLAIFYVFKKEYDTALRYLKKSLRVNPTFIGTWMYLGGIYRELKNYRKAIAMYKYATKIDPHVLHLYNNFAECYYYLKDYQKSICNAKKQLERDPDHFESLYFMGSSLYKLKRFDEALSFFKSALACDIWTISLSNYSNLQVWKKLGKLYLKTKDYQNALKVIRKIITIEPKNQTYLDLLRKIKAQVK